MNVLTAISPGLKVLFERVGKPEVVNRPDLFRSGEGCQNERPRTVPGPCILT